LAITSLRVSPDGQWIAFVRGGEHGGNSAARAVNPRSFVERQEILLYVMHVPSRSLRLIGQGDYPFFHPSSASLQYVKSGQIWTVDLGNSDSKPSQLFYTAGSVSSPQWSPDGRKLLFTVSRTTHSFIGVFDETQPTLQWIAPSFHRDRSPRWSPDGRSIAFVRTRAVGGTVDPVLIRKHQPWSIMVASLKDGAAQCVWTAPQTLEGSIPSWPGSFNLKWNLH